MSVGFMKKILSLLVAVSALVLIACGDDSSTAPSPDNPSSQAFEAGSSSSRGVGSSGSKRSGSDSKAADSSGTIESSVSRISPDNVISVVKGTFSEDKSKKRYLMNQEKIGECLIEGSKNERTVVWKELDGLIYFVPFLELDGEKLLLHADSNITYVFKDGPASKIDGMWNLDSIRVSESDAFISFDDNFDATLEISKGEFVLTFGLKGNDAGPIGNDIFGGTSPIFPRSDFIHKMYQALNGDGFVSLYIDDITSNTMEMFNLIRADSSEIKVTTKAYKDSSITFILNGTTYTATLESFVQNYYEGKEAVVSVKKDDTVCKWHQKEKNVSQDLCKIEYMNHLNEDENVYSESGRAVTKYWEGNRAEFVECLKGIATPPAE